MQRIKSVIIDDETANRNVLGSMLREHCPVIELVGDGASVEEGYELICKVKPDLIFLDVMMMTKTGFDLLRMFEDFPFHVIFVTAFDEYALQAFDFNAIDYILKPIDHAKLIRAVEKVNRAIHVGENSPVVHFIRSIDEQNQLVKSIPFHQKNKVVIVELDIISYIKADRNYCEVFTTDGQRILSTKSLSDYETLLEPYHHFLRINKSILINIRHIKEYSKGAECVLTMKCCNEEFEVSRRKKSQILSFLRN